MPLFYSKSALSENIHELPDGSLLCLNVPIARIGEQTYTSEELPDLQADSQGLIIAERHADDVFAKRTIASFEGATMTVQHPGEEVTPDNWRELSVGHGENVRQGSGQQQDLLVCDLLIKERRAIELVRQGVREISCGYLAEYEQIEPGRARQRNIIGNHIALVDKGRAGPRVAIKDQLKQGEQKNMSKGNAVIKKLVADSVRKAIAMKLKDEALVGGAESLPAEVVEEIAVAVETAVGEVLEQASLEAPADPAPTGDQPDVSAIMAMLEEIMILLRGLGPVKTDSDVPPVDPAVDENPDEENKPSAATGDTMGKAALLAPGINFTAMDSDNAVMRISLNQAMGKHAAIKDMVGNMFNGKTWDHAPAPLRRAAFDAAAEIIRATNNARTNDTLTNKARIGKDSPDVVTPDVINQKNKEFYSKGK